MSRRLQRRLYKELSAGRYGYVKLAAAAYSSLLLQGGGKQPGAGKDDGGGGSGGAANWSALLANELVVRSVVKRRRLFGGSYYLSFKEPQLGSAVGLLLSHPAPALRLLGVNLLIDFTRQQHTSDYVPQLEAFVPLICRYSSPGVAADGGGGAGGSSAAAAVATAKDWDALRAASLRALLEHLRFCARLSYVSYHLHTITFAVLECVEAAGRGAGADGDGDGVQVGSLPAGPSEADGQRTAVLPAHSCLVRRSG